MILFLLYCLTVPPCFLVLLGENLYKIRIGLSGFCVLETLWDIVFSMIPILNICIAIGVVVEYFSDYVSKLNTISKLENSVTEFIRKK